MKLFRKQSDPTLEYYQDVREQFHDSIVWSLGSNVWFHDRLQSARPEPIVPASDHRNPIDPSILKDTEHMEQWIEDIRSQVEQSLQRHGFVFDKVTLSVDWTDEDAPRRAHFNLEVHRTVPPERKPWYKRLFTTRAQLPTG